MFCCSVVLAKGPCLCAFRSTSRRPRNQLWRWGPCSGPELPSSCGLLGALSSRLRMRTTSRPFYLNLGKRLGVQLILLVVPLGHPRLLLGALLRCKKNVLGLRLRAPWPSSRRARRDCMGLPRAHGAPKSVGWTPVVLECVVLEHPWQCQRRASESCNAATSLKVASRRDSLSHRALLVTISQTNHPRIHHSLSCRGSASTTRPCRH
ncbi:hypothetical protein V8C86DRAFT_607804 [Haematococcus lacustris]